MNITGLSKLIFSKFGNQSLFRTISKIVSLKLITLPMKWLCFGHAKAAVGQFQQSLFYWLLEVFSFAELCKKILITQFYFSLYFKPARKTGDMKILSVPQKSSRYIKYKKMLQKWMNNAPKPYFKCIIWFFIAINSLITYKLCQCMSPSWVWHICFKSLDLTIWGTANHYVERIKQTINNNSSFITQNWILRLRDGSRSTVLFKQTNYYLVSSKYFYLGSIL